MNEPIAMCMGYHGRTCFDCKRLARDRQDEDAERWIEEDDCNAYRVIGSDDPRTIICKHFIRVDEDE